MLLIAIVTVPQNTNSSVFSLPIRDGKALPVFHECRDVFQECGAEEWRAEAEAIDFKCSC